MAVQAQAEVDRLQSLPLDEFADAGPEGSPSGGGLIGTIVSFVSSAWDTVTGWIGDDLDALQYVLDIAGLAPVVGNVADFANGGISLLRGNWAEAGLNFAAMIPGLGQGVTGAKLAAKGASLAGLGGFIVKHADEAAEFAKVIERHHLLPRQFAKHFRKAGIENIDDYVIELPRGLHRLTDYNGIHTGPRNWNKRWKEFFEENPNAKLEDVFKHLKRLIDEFEITQYVPEGML